MISRIDCPGSAALFVCMTADSKVKPVNANEIHVKS
jgi:hypothetical protein